MVTSAPRCPFRFPFTLISGGRGLPKFPGNSPKIRVGEGQQRGHGAGPGDGGHGGLGVPGLSPGAGAAGGGAGAAGAANPRPRARPRPGPRAPPPSGPAVPGRRRRFRGSRGRPGRGRRRFPQRRPGGRLGALQRRGRGQGQRTGHQERDPGLPGRGGAGADLHQQHGGGGAQHPRGPLRQGGRGDAVPHAALGAVPAEQGPGRAAAAGGQRKTRGRGRAFGDAVPASHGDFRGAPRPAGALLPAGEGPGGEGAPEPPPERRARAGLRRERGLDARAGRPRRPRPPGLGGRRVLLLLRRLALGALRGVQPPPAAPRRPLGGPPPAPGPGRAPGRPQRPPEADFGAFRGVLGPPAEPLHLGRGLHPLQRPHGQGRAAAGLPAALLLAGGPGQDGGVAAAAGRGLKG